MDISLTLVICSTILGLFIFGGLLKISKIKINIIQNVRAVEPKEVFIEKVDNFQSTAMSVEGNQTTIKDSIFYANSPKIEKDIPSEKMAQIIHMKSKDEVEEALEQVNPETNG